jgi:hypothetical protein
MCPANLEPNTKSASSLTIGFISLGISSGKYWPSASMLTIISAPIFTRRNSQTYKSYRKG